MNAPALVAAIRPGQFVMARLRGTSDPLLGRPFALYDTVLDTAGQPVAVDIVYLQIGKMTGRLPAVRAGDEIEVWGPLGNTFPDLMGVPNVALVAGVTLYYGVRSAELAAGVEDFRQAGAQVELAATTAAWAITAPSSTSCNPGRAPITSSAAAPNRCCTL